MASYYLSNNGDDANSGLSPSEAWRTLERASAHNFCPGDQLVLGSKEIFEGSLFINGEGPVTIATSGPARSTIKAGTGPGIEAKNIPLQVQNLRILGRYNHKTEGGNAAFGIKLAAELPHGERIRGTRLTNLRIGGFKYAGIGVCVGAAKGTKCGFEDLLIDGCHTWSNGDAGILIGGVMDQSSKEYCHKNIRIENCRVWGNQGIASLPHHTGSGIVISDVDQGAIVKCAAFNNGALNNFDGGGPVGIWCWDCNAVTISRCFSHHNQSKTRDGGGFDLDGGCTNCVMEYNTSHDNDGSGYLLCQFTDARPFHGNVVRHNVSVNDGQTNGGALAIFNFGSGISTCEFHHNRLVSGKGRGPEVPASIRLLTPTVSIHVHGNELETDGAVPYIEAVKGQELLRAHSNTLVPSESKDRFVFEGRPCTIVQFQEFTEQPWIEPDVRSH